MKTTKKEIALALRTENSTEIFKIAKKAGVDVSSKSKVFNFIKNNAPSKRISSLAYRLSYGAGDFKNYRESFKNPPFKMPISDAIRFAKMQKKEDMGNYIKILIMGNNNIYWAHPIYRHRDYNKSVAFEISDKNLKVAETINKFLGYNYEKRKN